MKLIRITLMEMKKSLHTDTVLSVVLLISIAMSYSVLIYYNDAFFSSQRLYMSSQIQLHSVDITFHTTVPENESGTLRKLLSSDFCDYFMFGFNVNTKNETYQIGNLWTLYQNLKNPYDLLYSTTIRKKLIHEPAEKKAYVSNLFTIGRQGDGLYQGGNFVVNGKDFQIEDFFVPTADIEVLISNADFEVFGKIDRVIYVYRESASLRDVNILNKSIRDLFPDVKISISNSMDSRSEESYRQSIMIFAVLIAACIVNYCLIFVYLAGKRARDYMIMRLFGVHRSQITVMLLTEFAFYNTVAILASMAGFTVYWKIISRTDIASHIISALPIMILFIAGSVIIGIINISEFSGRMPVAYKE